MKKRFYVGLVFLISIFSLPFTVKADNPNFSLVCYDSSGKVANNLSVKDVITCNVKVDSLEENINVLEGKYSYSDNLELVEVLENSAWNLEKSNNSFKYTYKNNDIDKINIAVLKFRVKKDDGNAIEVKLNNLLVKNDNKEYSDSASFSTEIKSCVNGLASLSVEDATISPKFSSNTLNYTVKVSEPTIKINATTLCNTSSLSGTGEKELEEGENTIKVIVTAEDGSKKIYNLVVTYEPKKSDVATLDELKIKEKDINFKKDTFEYDIDIENQTDKLTITYKATSSKAKVEVKGNEDLKEGENTIKVIVTAEDGSKKEYVITANIAKIDKSILEDLIIKDDKGNDIKLAPTFKGKTKNYTIMVTNKVTTLDIEATCKDDECKLDGVGKVSIKDKNKIEIKVTHGENETVYTINIRREVTGTKEKKSSSLWLIILIIIIFLIFTGIGTYFIMKKKKSPKIKKVKTPEVDLHEDIIDNEPYLEDPDTIIKETHNE